VKDSSDKADKLSGQTQEIVEKMESKNSHQSIISVDVVKLDRLMDLMGEMVIAEAMVTQNPDLKELKLNSFHKSARQLQKITSEMQDMVMSIRMVPSPNLSQNATHRAGYGKKVEQRCKAGTDWGKTPR
jgi:chemotaxis protein histidine kinase CheA